MSGNAPTLPTSDLMQRLRAALALGEVDTPYRLILQAIGGLQLPARRKAVAY